MLGWNRGKYERLMGKIFKDRPTQLCTFNVVKSKIGNPYSVVSVSFNVPCIINIETIKETIKNASETSTPTVARTVSYIVEKKYLEGKVFSNGTPVEIQKLMTHKSLSKYWGVQIVPVQSTVIDEEGMIPFNTVTVNGGNVFYGGDVSYGDFLDGAYRNYIEFVCYEVDVAI